MLEAFHPYFADIELPNALVKRIHTLYSSFLPLIDDPIKRVFITDSYDDNDVRRYGSLWLFGEKTQSECKNFISTDMIDFVRATRRFKVLRYIKSNYEVLDKPSHKSRLRVITAFSDGTPFELDAVSTNCKHLISITKTDFFPHLAE